MVGMKRKEEVVDVKISVNDMMVKMIEKEEGLSYLWIAELSGLGEPEKRWGSGGVNLGPHWSKLIYSTITEQLNLLFLHNMSYGIIIMIYSNDTKQE